ncbi:hypothetical protein D3872_05340 [Massilia cavernae]|uniref:DUF4306 domain-containing protein n=1 Tax=Massilia cavernae TaxID=2320864 RepID=A0A418Y5Y7_9BURK|nr:hypothetical protein D3872_05340 [Massilia cavernae]
MKLLRSLGFAILGIALFDTWLYKDAYNIHDYLSSLNNAPAIFFGATEQVSYVPLYAAVIVATRLTLFALFTAILIKRFSRR